jgi:hypothetical protein
MDEFTEIQLMIFIEIIKINGVDIVICTGKYLVVQQ